MPTLCYFLLDGWELIHSRSSPSLIFFRGLQCKSDFHRHLIYNYYRLRLWNNQTVNELFMGSDITNSRIQTIKSMIIKCFKIIAVVYARISQAIPSCPLIEILTFWFVLDDCCKDWFDFLFIWFCVIGLDIF